EEAYYTQFGAPFQGGGYRATAQAGKTRGEVGVRFYGGKGGDKELVEMGEVGGFLLGRGDGGEGGRLGLCLQGSRIALWYFRE
ncbi:hypothetical protein Tco_0847174, partial [Tanacetum coccineum]